MRRFTLSLVGLLGLFSLSCSTGGGIKPGAFRSELSGSEILARILVLEDSRSLGAGTIQGDLQHRDAGIRRRAAIAAGRIGDVLAVPRLIEKLRDEVAEVRRAAALALGLIGSPEAVAALTASLADADALTRGRAAEALSRIGQASSGPDIAQAFRRALPQTPSGVLRIRGDNPGRADDPWVELRLHLFALARLKDAASLANAVIGSETSPFVDWWAGVWAAARVGDPRLTPVLLAGAGAEDAAIRALAVKGLGALKDPAHIGVIRKLATDREPAVVREALRAAARVGGLEAAAVAALHLDSPNLVLKREALLALAALPPVSKYRVQVIENVGHTDPWVRSAAWPALIKIDAEDVGIVLSTIGPDSDWQVRQAVAQALGENLGERAASHLLAMLDDADPRVVPAVLSALASARGENAAPTLRDHVAHTDMGIRAAAVEGLSSLQALGKGSYTQAFARAFDASIGDDDLEVRITVVDAVAKDRSEESRTLLRRIAGSDPSRVVRQKALSALGEGVAPPEETGLRLADARRLTAVYEPEAGALFSPRVLISTRHGVIELALDVVEAPLTSMSFVRLAQAGFYNGLTFHRVIPGFVAQGGDPRGDGYGGPGFTLRCEYSGRPFGRGALGMATAGKDTAGSQFFIALEAQPHLDSNYTQFGQVLSGMDVVEKIRPGDVILRIDAFDGRETR
jgi:cyclophilin family peptidyl-prolyl cis-trans isomerase/HEAT repeat protein